MNKEILEKIESIRERYPVDCMLLKELRELRAMIEESQEKSECDFIPGQVIKGWNDQYNSQYDIFESLDSDGFYVCKEHSYIEIEPLPLESYIANIAYYMPDAVKAVVDVEGFIYFKDGNDHVIVNGNADYCSIPYPNNTGKGIEIDIER